MSSPIRDIDRLELTDFINSSRLDLCKTSLVVAVETLMLSLAAKTRILNPMVSARRQDGGDSRVNQLELANLHSQIFVVYSLAIVDLGTGGY